MTAIHCYEHATSAMLFYPIFILDPAFTQSNKQMHGTGINRPSQNVFAFFFETLADLQQSLSSPKYKSNLFVLRGDPIQIFPHLLSKLKATDLYFEIDTEPYAKRRDAQIIEVCKRLKVKANTDFGHTLYPMEQIIACSDSMSKGIPKTYKAFCNLITKMGPPQEPKDAPSKIPNNGIDTLFQNKQFVKEMTAISKMNQFGFRVPNIEELEYKNDETQKVNEYEIEQTDIDQTFRGGESNAIKTMDAYLIQKEKVCKFEKPKTSPNALTAQTTTLSMYLTNGSLSVRLLWHRINEIYKKSMHGYTKPPTSLHGQLYFREFFYLQSSVTTNYHQMKNNKLCKQIEWNKYDEIAVNKWKYGQTGFPFIDALMIQLRKTGWMHHLGRHAVACFLTRGDLWQSWEVGRDIFSEYLLDGDYALNASNWMWLSASAYFTAYFRVYSPVSFGKKTDKNGDFIKKYIPKLRLYPKKYIYEPWTAPKELQKQWGCVIGVDYPMPMVDHKEVSKANMAKMKIAYQKNRDLGKRKLEKMDVDGPVSKKRKIARK